MPMIKASILMIVSIKRNGKINLTQVCRLIFTIANEGRIKPVGARKDIKHMPNI